MIEGTRVKKELAATVGDWFYVSCHCIVKVQTGVSFTYECDGCGNTSLRFIHTLENEKDKRRIQVGIQCARTLLPLDEWEIPRLAEAEVQRKERWRIRYNNPGWCIVTEQDLIDRGVL